MTDPTLSPADEAPPVEDLSGPLEFDCPRCGTAVIEEFYGPCELCRAVLRTEQAGEGADVEAAAYEPKMNVTPNAVATKD
ncbi:MAG: hypothetical protein ACOYOP_04290 [Microthrixaceae bacterium]